MARSTAGDPTNFNMFRAIAATKPEKSKSRISYIKGWALGDAWKAGSVPATTRWWGPQCF